MAGRGVDPQHLAGDPVPNAPTAKISVPTPTGGEGSVSVRKISNGYIINQSSWNGDEYRSTETYSKEKPTIEVE